MIFPFELGTPSVGKLRGFLGQNPGCLTALECALKGLLRDTHNETKPDLLFSVGWFLSSTKLFPAITQLRTSNSDALRYLLLDCFVTWKQRRDSDRRITNCNLVVEYEEYNVVVYVFTGSFILPPYPCLILQMHWLTLNWQ